MKLALFITLAVETTVVQVLTPNRITISEPQRAQLIVKTVEGRCGGHRFQVVYAPSLTDPRRQVLSITHNEQEVPDTQLAKLYGEPRATFVIQDLGLGKCLSDGGSIVGVELNLTVFRPGKASLSHLQFRLRKLEILEGGS